jgi:L-iditol 2-dehydrogenase
VFDATQGPVQEWAREQTEGRGADVTFLAATGQAALDAAIAATRPGGRIVPFSATSKGETYSIDLGVLAASEKQIVSVYSASVDVQSESADLVFRGRVKVQELLTNFFPLRRINDAIDLFRKPNVTTLKIAIDMRLA